MACRTCGTELVETLPATMSSPAEWECPCCDGDMTPEQYRRLLDLQDDALDQYDEDDRYHQPED